VRIGAGFLLAPLATLLATPGELVAAAPASSPSISSDHPLSRAESEESSLFALPTTHDHIGRVVVAAMVNGKGPFRFIVDTGATHSTVSP
jgi:predicted aspartyl protease